MEEVFECPMCKKLIDISVNKCPGCGTEFIEEAPATPAQPIPKKGPSKPLPEAARQVGSAPQAKPPEKPASFADRMRQMKDTPQEQKPVQTGPAIAAERPMSFADRMKAMREGGTPSQPAKPGTTTKPTSVGATQFASQLTQTKHGVLTKEEEFKELPRLIGEVRKLLVVAKDCGIDITKSKMLISRAITSSKNKDLASAVKLVKEGKLGLVNDLRTYTMTKHRTLTNTLSLARKGGKDITNIERILENIRKCVGADDYLTALSEMKRAEDMAEGLSGGTALSEVEIDVIARIIEDALLMSINVTEAKGLYEQVRKASEAGDMSKVSSLSKEINDSLMKILPRYIANEMRKAKADLRDIKMMNVDISHPVDILKRANDSVRDGDYGTALHSMKEFKDFLVKLQKST